jgi:hypothetical protein
MTVFAHRQTVGVPVRVFSLACGLRLGFGTDSQNLIEDLTGVEVDGPSFEDV